MSFSYDTDASWLRYLSRQHPVSALFSDLHPIISCKLPVNYLHKVDLALFPRLSPKQSVFFSRLVKAI